VSHERIVIAGAGIGGLTAAAALSQAGIPVLLLERMPQLAEIGAGMTLAMNAKAALRTLGLTEQVEAAGHGASAFVHRSRRGRVLARWDMDSLQQRLGERATALPRGALQRILVGALGESVELRCGATVTGVEQDPSGVSVRLSDGNVLTGAVLVGADGLHSAIRPSFDSTPLHYCGFTAWRGTAEIDDARAMGIDMTAQTQSYGLGSVFGTIPLSERSVYWYATSNTPAGGTDEPGRRKARLRELLGDWHAPVPALIEATAEESIARTDVYDLPRREHWGAGRVTLLGDAAHPTAPTLGQGACLAIEDGVVLARHLCASLTPDSLRAYERERIPRTAATVHVSGLRARIVQVDRRAAAAARDLSLRAVPFAVVERQLAKVFGFPG
jgi:2-polyprenyl-6-methoxyphenol hydroxylase-like FAD-dependent oxidoreductase